jgi:hypothetical protein
MMLPDFEFIAVFASRVRSTGHSLSWGDTAYVDRLSTSI